MEVVTYISIVLAALVTGGLGVPLIQRKVPPNAMYGLRTQATRQSESVWYEANARTGRHLICLAIIVLVVVAVGAFTVKDGGLVALAASVIAVIGALTFTFMDTRYANRLLEAEQQRSPDNLK